MNTLKELKTILTHCNLQVAWPAWVQNTVKSLTTNRRTWHVYIYNHTYKSYMCVNKGQRLTGKKLFWRN